MNVTVGMIGGGFAEGGNSRRRGQGGPGCGVFSCCLWSSVFSLRLLFAFRYFSYFSHFFGADHVIQLMLSIQACSFAIMRSK